MSRTVAWPSGRLGGEQGLQGAARAGSSMEHGSRDGGKSRGHQANKVCVTRSPWGRSRLSILALCALEGSKAGQSDPSKEAMEIA